MVNDVLIYFKDETEQIQRLGYEINEDISKSPHSVILKGRLYAELLAKHIAKIEKEEELNLLTQAERLRRLSKEGLIDNEIEKAFNHIRKLGNIAAHDEIEGDLEAALSVHRNLHKITCWFIGVYEDPEFKTPLYKTPNLTKEENYTNFGEVLEALDEFKKIMSTATMVETQGNNNVEKELSITTTTQKKPINENLLSNESLKNKDSLYVAYCKEELQKYFSEDEWRFNKTNGCITAYNKRFQEELFKVSEDMSKKVKFQIWMRKPVNEKANLQIEIAGGSRECKELRLILSNSFKKLLKKVDYLEIASNNVGVILTLKMDALGILNGEDDTIENLEINKVHIEDSVSKFSQYLDKDMINSWIDNEVPYLIQSHFGILINA